MSNPFEAAIDALRAEHDRWFLDTEKEEHGQVDAAIRVLEAAAKIDKDAAWTALDWAELEHAENLTGQEGMTKARWLKHMRAVIALVEALPARTE